MDDQTLARFKASGEKDLSVFLAKQGAQNDLPPGVGGYGAGTQSFAGSTASERGTATAAPSYRDQIKEGFARLSGLPAALRQAGESLGIISPPPAPNPNILNASSRQGNLEAGLNDLEARSTQLSRTPAEVADAEATRTRALEGPTKVLNAFVTGKPLLTPEEEAKKKQTDKILNSRAIGENVISRASKLRSLTAADPLSPNIQY